MFEAILALMFTFTTGIILRAKYRETQYRKWLNDRNIY